MSFSSGSTLLCLDVVLLIMAKLMWLKSPNPLLEAYKTNVKT